MKSMGPPLAAIFFMTYFYRAGGAWPPRHPLDPLLNEHNQVSPKLHNVDSYARSGIFMLQCSGSYTLHGTGTGNGMNTIENNASMYPSLCSVYST